MRPKEQRTPIDRDAVRRAFRLVQPMLDTLPGVEALFAELHYADFIVTALPDSRASLTERCVWCDTDHLPGPEHCPDIG